MSRTNYHQLLERVYHRLDGNILNARHTYTQSMFFTHRYAAAIFLIITNRRMMMIIMMMTNLSFWPGSMQSTVSSSTSEGDKRKWVQARSQQSNAIWLSFRGNMASDQTVSQKQGRGSISGTSMRAETRVHALTHAQRHWLKMWTHTVIGICVALCVVAKAMKQNHGRRNVHFAQRTLNSTTDTQAVKFQNRFCLFWQVNTFHHPKKCDLSFVKGSKMDFSENDLFALETYTSQHADSSSKTQSQIYFGVF